MGKGNSKFDFKDVRIEIAMMASALILSVVGLYFLYQVKCDVGIFGVTSIASGKPKLVDLAEDDAETRLLVSFFYIQTVTLALALVTSLVLEHQRTSKLSKQLILGSMYALVVVASIITLVETNRIRTSVDGESDAWKSNLVDGGYVFEILSFTSSSLALFSCLYLGYTKLLM